MSGRKSSDSETATTRVIVDTASASASPLEGAASSELIVDGDVLVVQRRTVHAGPLPDPATLQGLVAIYPDAAKIIFEDFHAQSAHRRELERLRIATSTTLALRSQMIGGGLGAIGLVGRFIVAGLGSQIAASAIGSASLVSLVSVFVIGRDKQRKERVEKAAVREKIRQGEPVEEIEKAPPIPKPARSTNRSKKPKID